MAKRKRGNNEGSIFRRSNGKWRAQITIGSRRLSYEGDTQADCQAWVRRRLGEVDAGLDYDGGELPLKEYLARWLKSARVSLRDKTAQQYERAIANYILPHIGHLRLMDLRLDRIEQFYGQLGGEGRGARTIRVVHSILHRSLEQAVRYSYIVRNPSHGASLPRQKQQEMLVLDEGEVSRFLIAAQGSSYEAVFRMAVVTGMRQAELFGLQWSDLSWHKGTLHIQRQVQRVKGKSQQFLEPKTRAGRRVISLSDEMLMVLRRHKQRQDQQREVMRHRWQENNLIFTNTVGNPLDQANMRKEFNRVLAEAGLPRIRFHDLRHTAASLLLNNGIPVIVVSRMLGHSKPSVTLDIYGHLYHDKQNQAARVLEGLIAPTPVQIPDRVDVLNRR